MYLRLGQIWVQWAPKEAKPLQMVGLVVGKVGGGPLKLQLEGGPGGIWLGGMIGSECGILWTWPDLVGDSRKEEPNL